VYKYTFKSPDFTAITVDEIQAHLTGRLLSVSEAVHRLLALPLHKEWPPVVRLDVHLPRQQTVVFDPTVDESTLLAQLEITVSTLMGWFNLNRIDTFARTICYHETPEWFTWSKGMWHRRSNRKMAVGRIFGVSPQNIELHSLRRLLSVVKGATSFDDLATVVSYGHGHSPRFAYPPAGRSRSRQFPQRVVCTWHDPRRWALGSNYDGNSGCGCFC
jgi:hypothetical protein